jgi:DNA (cytosine-5)-methyltransferase 1
MLTAGDLFSGIGGFSLGLERAGMRTAWFAETDPFASAVLRKHWPEVPNHGDVRSIRAGAVERVDVLCGGFPCQDISVAGSGAGLDGERSGLWREYARIIGELRPRYVIVENVAALLGRGLDRVLGDLSALGYDAEWHVIPAAAVGAPHRRDRVWIIATDADRRQRDESTDEVRAGRNAADYGGAVATDATLERVEGRRPDRIEVAFTPALARLLGRDDAGAFWSDGAAESPLRGVDDGIPPRLDRGRLACLGNAVVPQIVEMIGRGIIEGGR